jgi:outer membrane protein, heavy metal efflux system
MKYPHRLGERTDFELSPKVAAMLGTWTMSGRVCSCFRERAVVIPALVGLCAVGCTAPMSFNAQPPSLVRASLPGGMDEPAAGKETGFAAGRSELPAPRVIESEDAAPAKALTLDRAINTTLIADPKLRAGFEAINQANAELLTASLPPNPSLNLDAQLLPLGRPFTVDKQGGPPQGDAQLSYQIDWYLFGKRAAAMASASLGVRVSEADYADLIRQRVTETAVTFYDVLEAKALLDLAKQDVDNFKKLEEVLRKAVADGGKPQVDLNRVRLDLLTSQRALQDAEVAVVAAQAHLRSLIGRTDSDPKFEVDGDLTGKLAAEPIAADEAYASAVENRPDIRSNKFKIEQATADTLVEDRKAYPEITPQMGYTRQFQEKAIGFPDANSYSVAVTTTLPFLDRNQGNRAKARSIVVQRRLELQGDLVDLRSEIEQVVKQFRAAYVNATSVGEEQLKLATEVRDSINKAYEVGGQPLVDVLDAERNFRDTYRTYITGRANYWRALYKLNSAVGKQVVK